MIFQFGLNFLNIGGKVESLNAQRFKQASVYDAGNFIGSNIDTMQTIADLSLNANDPDVSHLDPSVIASPIGKFGFTAPNIQAGTNATISAHGIGVINTASSAQEFRYRKASSNSSIYAYNNSNGPAPTVINRTSHCRRLTRRQQKNFGLIDDFGINVYGATGKSSGIVIDHSKSPMYIHRYPDGSVIQYATARSYPYTFGYSDRTSRSFDALDITPNVIFPKAYDNPPLIFILSSTNSISLYQFNQDVNGKYVSASIITDIKFGANASTLGGSWLNLESNASFSYYIVSEEVQDDTPGFDNTFGMQIFNASGTSIFRNDRIPVQLYAGGYEVPYTNVSFAGNNSGGVTTTINRAGADIPLYQNEAVCINQINATRHVIGRPVTVLRANGDYSYFASSLILGDYLTFISDADGGRKVRVEPKYTNEYGYQCSTVDLRTFMTYDGYLSDLLTILISSYSSINQTVEINKEIKNKVTVSNITGTSSIRNPEKILSVQNGDKNDIAIYKQGTNRSGLISLYTVNKNLDHAVISNEINATCSGISVGLPNNVEIKNYQIFDLNKVYESGEIVYASGQFYMRSSFSPGGLGSPSPPTGGQYWIYLYYGPHNGIAIYRPSLRSYDVTQVKISNKSFNQNIKVNTVLTKRSASSSSIINAPSPEAQSIGVLKADLTTSAVSYINDVSNDVEFSPATIRALSSLNISTITIESYRVPREPVY